MIGKFRAWSTTLLPVQRQSRERPLVKAVGLKTADHRSPPQTTADYRRPPQTAPQTTTGRGK